MIDIVVNGQALDFGRGDNFTLERWNPLLDTNTIRGNRILDFEIPQTPGNNRVFGNVNNPQTGLRRELLACALRLAQGGVVERGFLQLKQILKYNYTVTYTAGFGEMFGEWTDKKLNELDLGSEAVPGVFVADPVVGTAKYCWPKMKNEAFYGQNGFSGYMNNYVSGSYTGTPMVPMLFVTKVLELIGTLTGVTFGGTFMSDATIKRLIVPNTASLDGLTTISYARHLPELTVREFVLGLANTFNVALWLNAERKTVTMDLADGWYSPGFGSAQPPMDWSRKFGRLVERVPLAKNRLQLEWTKDGNDGLSTPLEVTYLAPMGLSSTLEVTNQWNVKSPFFGVLMEGGLPVMSMEGVSENYNQLSKKFGARLAFWNGLSPLAPGGGTTYPVASDTYGGKYLRLRSDTGQDIRSGYWVNFERFLSKTYSVVGRTLLNSYELSLLDMHKRKGEVTQVYAQGAYYMIGHQRIQKNGEWSGELWRV